jgi:adenylyltransferase/sulfurtransferase
MEEDSRGSRKYSRQSILKEIGEDGQRVISRSRVAVIGVGATGSMSSTILVRAGIGFIRIVDRDIVELSNIHRQVLYTEDDAIEGLPKAVAAGEHLSAMNKDISIETVSDHVSPRNIGAIAGDVDIIIDGTDNMETRYLINDFSVKQSVPWVYGGALGTGGMAMVIIPGEGPCLRCVFPESPGPGKLGTCETVGVLGSVPSVTGSYQAMAAIRHIVSGVEKGVGKLLVFDLWNDEFSVVAVRQEKSCPTCGRNEFPYLEEERETAVVTTCGEGVYQIYPPEPKSVDLEERAKTLKEAGKVVSKGHYITFESGSRMMIIFADGRASVKGMNNRADALKFYTQYLGM